MAEAPAGLFNSRWLVMKDVLTVFSDLSVPFTLEGGSLLHLVRNCSLGGSDLDFVIQLGWLNNSNSQLLDSALKRKGLEKGGVHGVREYLGFEESWRRDDIKVCSCMAEWLYSHWSRFRDTVLSLVEHYYLPILVPRSVP